MTTFGQRVPAIDPRLGSGRAFRSSNPTVLAVAESSFFGPAGGASIAAGVGGVTSSVAASSPATASVTANVGGVTSSATATSSGSGGSILVASAGITPTSFATGAWPASAFNNGVWRFSFTPTQASSNAYYNDWKALVVANDNGGLYLVGNTHAIELYNSAGAGPHFSQVISWTAGQTITVTIDTTPGAGKLTISGAATGNVTNASWTPSGTYFTASTSLGVGRYPGDLFYDYANATFSNITDASPPACSISANVGGITSSTTAIPGTYASSTAAVAGISSTMTATSPGVGSIAASSGGITSTITAASPALASITADVGGIASAITSAGPGSFGGIGESTASQRADQTGATSGTMTTAFTARTPSASVVVNDRLAFNGRRWIVNTAGTLSSGAGPSASGSQTDGTATLVAMTSTDVALTMTTQAANSVIVACVMRDQWSKDSSAPTDNKGNTYTIQGTSHAYLGFATAASAVFAVAGAAGGSGHTLSLTWPSSSSNVTGAEQSILVVEVPTRRSNPIVQAASFVERLTAASVTSASVTTTGPAVLVAFWLGTGGVVTVGTAHPGAPQSPLTSIPNADTAVAIHNNGYIQAKAAWAYQAEPGTYTATWTGTSEGAQLYLVAIQEAPGTLATVAGSVGGITSSMTAGPAASAAANVGGVTSTIAASTGTSASISAAVAGITSALTAITGTLASLSAQVGGVSSALGAGPSASLSASVGGVTSAIAATRETFAALSASVAGVTSSAAALTPAVAQLAAAVAGVTSVITASTAGTSVASVAASIGGISSTMTAAPAVTTADVTASSGGIASAITASSTAQGAASIATSSGGITSTLTASSPSVATMTATVGGITAVIVAGNGDTAPALVGTISDPYELIGTLEDV